LDLQSGISGSVREKITVRPMTAAVGAEIGGISLAQPLSIEARKTLIDSLNQWGVIAIRGQSIGIEELKRFGEALGPTTLAHPHADGMQGHSGVWERTVDEYKHRLQEDKEAMITRRPPKDYKGWHIDLSYVVNPVRYSVLHGVEIPDFGGDTVFCSLRYAYAALAPQIRAFLDTLSAVHQSDDHYSIQGRPRRANIPIKSYASIHPLVRIHPETGARVLFFNPGAITHFPGLKEREGKWLFDFLSAEICRIEYMVRIRWEPGTVLVWDNQQLVHAGPADYQFMDARRTVRRVTVKGERPIGASGFVSESLEGDPWE